LVLFDDVQLLLLDDVGDVEGQLRNRLDELRKLRAQRGKLVTLPGVLVASSGVLLLKRGDVGT